MKVINPIGRTMVADTDANYEAVEPQGGCICYDWTVFAQAEGTNFLCIGCRSNCFPNNPDNQNANQGLATAKVYYSVMSHLS